ncbi:MAG: TetR/AcrR family transcriptional regulator C-terminal domain-containing protein [Ketobacter sp.]|nr:MAG: TetR/AcrR family transcriptional regulator [Ketobacter sp.]
MTRKPIKTKSATRPRGRPRPEDVGAIESKYLEVALKEFLQYGYGDAAMARIAQAAGGSKTTLYSRYPSKEDLFRAIIFDQIARASPEAALRSGAAPLGLEQGLKSFANHMLEHSLQADQIAVNKLMYSESYRFPELGVASAEKTNRGILRISAFIRESASRDRVPCANPDAVAKAFIFMIRGWYIHHLLTDTTVTDKERKQWVDQAVNTLVLSREDW